ncbi:hypothetical protein ACFSKW_51020 [Nonomuraea mangrovi]|uniref:Uncharacterized protein n=1 Tax=Nonomuraea mangrovi TaxID=2316207 RepID=A0ABW4TCS9_9ACTN
MTANPSGFTVRTSGLRARASYADGEADTLWWEKRALLDVFMIEGNPLGKDQYGIELERKLSTIQDGIMDAFDACVTEAEGIRDKLADTGSTYDSVEPGWERTALERGSASSVHPSGFGVVGPVVQGVSG